MTKEQFVQRLGDLFCAAGIQQVSSMEYKRSVEDVENDCTYDEAVIIHFTPFYATGEEYSLVINVNMDSCWGILQDIIKRLGGRC